MMLLCHSRILRTVGCICLLRLAATALAQSDTCATAPTIAPGDYSGDTASASNDGATSCGDSSSTPDVWYRFTATSDLRLTVDSCGSDYDTVLSLHTGCPATSGNELACNDDSCGFGSRVRANLSSGQTVYIRVSGWQGHVGAYVLHVATGPIGGGADAYLGELADMRQFGREGDIIGCGIDTPLCNAGDEPLDWFGNPDPRHPMAVFNFYQRSATRLEQIGQSWAKHGFGAAQLDTCGFGCIPNPDYTRLGVGCSDTYDAGTNAEFDFLGPRSEINPWTGAYVFAGSYLDEHSGDPHDDVEHRLQIHDVDLTAGGPDITYICEVHIVCHDDIEHLNSVAWEPVELSGAPGNDWTFDISGAQTQLGPALHAWTGASQVVIPPQQIDDGRCFLSWKTSPNGNGTWHYEYALYNFDMDRGVQALHINMPASVTLTNIGFHAVESHGEGMSNAPWTTTRDASGLTWATQTFAQNPLASALRWGTMYNFWFDASAAPGTGAASLNLFKPGTPTTLTAAGVQTPGGSCVGDVNGDGVVDLQDLAQLLSHFGSGGATPSEGDLDGDQDVDLADLAQLLSAFGTAC
jgi:hypothetical protein